MLFGRLGREAPGFDLFVTQQVLDALDSAQVVAERRRNWTARFQQRLQMGLGSLLKGQLGARQVAGNWTKPGLSSSMLKPLFEFSERSADSHVRKSAGTSLD